MVGYFIFIILLEDTGIWNYQPCRMDSEWGFSVLGGKGNYFTLVVLAAGGWSGQKWNETSLLIVFLKL